MEHYAPAQQVFAAGLIFARLGPILMLIPGFGETFVPVRVRLSLGLLMALVLFPVVGSSVPAIPSDVSGVILAVIKESAIGLMLGTILRMFVSSLAATGEIVSIQTTLAFAQTTNPTQATPSTTLGTFLGLLGLVLIMSTNLHHLFLSAIVRSYTLFPFTRPLPLADANALAIQTVSQSFALGVQLAAPVVAFSLIFNVAVGMVGRVMPQFQIFFVSSPLMILLGLSIFALSLGTIGMVWIDHYRDLLATFG
ncbi:flagellar biosynthetic protein FliR [Phenylobacterium sp.]|jgi:flagellar biosynthesis protein FliR|uniref:flagellar biosynthetic protein FliR n=1 Tax=Phenylobacterium sp. TaxID=1871053 RepID=UPI0011F4A9A6|nr:flagellar biosynthetic protein FliR [Phenylobacterium sp.]THD58742.1 MAG: flagellar type III secretion system protein FliR [Phenylobacterium sp.]